LFENINEIETIGMSQFGEDCRLREKNRTPKNKLS
jgi:hypothetical protein